LSSNFTAQLTVIGIALLLVAGCSSRSILSPDPTQDNATRSLTLCTAGLSEHATADIEAAFQRSGGKITASVERALRGAVFELVSRSDLTPEGRERLFGQMYPQYLSCIRERQQEGALESKALTVASCQRSCCDRLDCEDYCVMQQVSGLSVPVSPPKCMYWIIDKFRVLRSCLQRCEGIR
jgi:hypothetical protein